MALYFYHAFAKDGKKVSGSVDATSVQGVKEQLQIQGLFPITITAGTLEKRQPWWKRIFSRGVSVKDKILFTKQLSILLKSGIPLLQALELLVDHFTGSLKDMLVTIKDDLKEGMSFADALKKYPRTFDMIYVQLVRAGEASGKLELVLERLTSYMERRAAVAKRIKKALQNPLMQLGVSIIVVAVLLIFVVPGMVENFASNDRQLPTPTRILIGISSFFTHYYLLIIGFIIAATFSLRYWRSTPSGKLAIDRFILRIPIIGYFAKIQAVVQFSYTLGILIESGVNLAEALDIVCSIVGNKVLADALNEARDKIIKQGRIAQYLKQTNIFPPIAIYLIQTGEQSGQLDFMLLTVAKNYEEDLSELSDSLAAKMGPILLLVMAVVVGFIVIAIMLPMTQSAELAAG